MMAIHITCCGDACGVEPRRLVSFEFQNFQQIQLFTSALNTSKDERAAQSLDRILLTLHLCCQRLASNHLGVALRACGEAPVSTPYTLMSLIGVAIGIADAGTTQHRNTSSSANLARTESTSDET